MGKWDKLENHLRRQPGPSVVLTFAQIKGITGNQPPPNTQKSFIGWDYRPLGTRFSKTWHNAGFKTVMVDLENEKVRFQRIEGG